MNTIIRILVTGGGTGGHVSPALATVRELTELAQTSSNPTWRPVFRYIGSKNGVEKRLAEEAGLPFVGVSTGKLRRAFKLRDYFSRANITDVFHIPLGVAESLVQVFRFRPNVVLSTGGYVCVPPVIAAWLLRVPIVTHEQTVQIGLANRIAARFATRIALTFEGAITELPKRLQRRAFVSGNPVRPAIFGGNPEKAVQHCGFVPEDNELPTIYVTGGAQGARIINRTIEEKLPELLELCRIVHQCGQQPANDEQDYDRLEAKAAQLPPALRQRYFLTRFVGAEIGDIFALSNLVVSRSGAGTVTEVCALGKPALFVPLVPTGGDEQTKNAQRSVQIGAAIIIKQAELNGVSLYNELAALLPDRTRLANMGQAALTLARPQAAHDLAQTVLALAIKSNKPTQ
jgi:UDP-N-acetylglucosamine--N-acetylmuramyl-(pentapeptide) pyrophosphoryl-undecaprenol N-acetylglucosamine transferase